MRFVRAHCVKPESMEDGSVLSVIVPVLNEEKALPAFLRMVDTWPEGCEVLFTDGGSEDGTLRLLEGRTVVTGAHGRGAQCRLAVQSAQGDCLAFVHVDSVVEAQSIRAIMDALVDGVSWGCLTLRFKDAGPALAFGARMSNLRVRIWGTPFGDQVMFMTRSLYDQVGGMPDLPLMEDYELSRRLAAVVRPRQLPEQVVTSARRFNEGGVMRTMIEMRHLRHLYRSGVPVDELARRYAGSR